MRNYSGFYQDLSGYYMVFLNYIAALSLTGKIVVLQFLSDYTGLDKFTATRPIGHAKKQLELMTHLTKKQQFLFFIT